MDRWPDGREWWVAPTLDRRAAESWISARVDPVGDIELAHERPWATVLRVPLADGVAWFKACASIQSFEPRLTHDLFARWPDRVAEVLAHDDERAWLLLGDAGEQSENSATRRGNGLHCCPCTLSCSAARLCGRTPRQWRP